MNDAVERLLVRIDASTENLRRELKRADNAVAASDTKMQKALGNMSAGWQGADKWVKKHNNELKLMGAAAVGATTLAIRSISGYSDTYKSLRGQVKLVTDDQNQLNSVWASTLDISDRTGSEIAATTGLYTKLTRSTKELGLSQAERLKITEAITKTTAISGATHEQASRALLQYNQALSGGILRAEEYNSISEQAPYILDLLAESLGKTRGELRKMVVDGQVTSEMMVTSMLEMSSRIDSEFAQLPEPVSRAMNQIRNSMLTAFGSADLDPLIDSLHEFSDIVSDPATSEGLTDIASAIVRVGAAATRAATILPALTKFLSEGFGASLGNYSIDTLVDTADSIGRITKEIQFYEEAGQGASVGVQELSSLRLETFPTSL